MKVIIYYVRDVSSLILSLHLKIKIFCGCSVEGKIVKMINSFAQILDFSLAAQRLSVFRSKILNYFILRAVIKNYIRCHVCAMYTYSDNDIWLLSLGLFLRKKQCSETSFVMQDRYRGSRLFRFHHCSVIIVNLNVV